jgi:hypothetical protein
MIKIRVALLVALLALPAAAQQPRQPPLRLGETLLNLPTPRVLTDGRWEVRFTHRFSQPINEGDVHSLWGLDLSADIGLGLAYSVNEDLMVSIFRTDVQDNVEAAVKYVVLRQPNQPISAAVRAGADWKTERGIQDRLSAFAQAVLSRRLGQKAEVFVLPTYVSNTDLFDEVFNVPVALAWSIYPHLSLIVEVIPENADLPDSIDSSFGWSVGLKRAIGGHYFEILLSNTRATHVDQYAPSAFGGGLEAGDVHLGFNIERRFGTRLR